ncbi:MAG TPA: nucleotide exchange factor GrpE [Clostridia bacterium]|nr:MAG: heat shock protein GrpE [Firmicutes bacterium ADurb.Bin356]HOF95189.1 nucleotide exchange factor GrpE [Clostridia bacterium]
MAKKTTNETILNSTDQPQGGAVNEAAVETAEQGIKLTQTEFESVKAHIEALQKEKEEAVSLAQRLQADFDNYRKRNASLKTDCYEEGVRDCIETLLPTLDSFDFALESMTDLEPCFVDGVRLVKRMLIDALAKLGFEEVPADGAFDPVLHNAVMQEEAEGKNPGEVLEVLQKGYRVKGRILRHSMVKVAK